MVHIFQFGFGSIGTNITMSKVPLAYAYEPKYHAEAIENETSSDEEIEDDIPELELNFEELEVEEEDEVNVNGSETETAEGAEGGNRDNSWRLTDKSWCECGDKCEIMPTAEECECCHENCEKRLKEESINCVTEHSDFYHFFLHPEGLKIGLYLRNDLRPGSLSHPISNETLRFQAYRQFIYWIYGKMGYKNRAVIPSCVVTRVRLAFPEESGYYRGFMRAEFSIFHLIFL